MKYFPHQNLLSRGSQPGVTLIEMMVSMTIGMFLIGGAVTVYMQSKTNYRTTDNVSRVQENIRFVMDTIEPDLRQVGFWGRNKNGFLVGNTAGVQVFCGGADISAWAIGNLGQGIQVLDNTFDAAVPCGPNTVARPNSDVLAIRHASSAIMPANANQIQLLSDLFHGELFRNGVPPVAGFDVGAQIHDLVVNVYYVDNNSNNPDPGARFATPSLRQKTLVNGVLTDQELMPGVENMQIQLGLDTNGTGTVDSYVDPSSPAVPGATVMAVRLWMLVRAEIEEFGYGDPGPYTTPDLGLALLADFPIIPGGAPGPATLYPDGFRRLQVTKTIFLRN